MAAADWAARHCDAVLGPEVLARLARSLAFWQRHGFAFVPLPWVAPARYTDATKPAFVTTPDLATPYGNLLASGEQAFLMLFERGQLPAGSGYIGWTPCYRDEPTFDESHQFYFMKSELFVPADSPAAATRVLGNLVEHTRTWMQEEFAAAGVRVSLETEVTGADQVDLVVAGLELGSYGVRQFAGGTYLYGTACAEPRFSLAIARSGQ